MKTDVNDEDYDNDNDICNRCKNTHLNITFLQTPMFKVEEGKTIPEPFAEEVK